MADFAATIHVAEGQTVWRADEVPHLTADALYRFEPEPDPLVAKTELRRMTGIEHRNGAPGRQLTAGERARMDRKCKEAGLDALPDEARYRRWGEYLEACNDDAEARGWWVALIPPRDPNQNERLAWVIAAEEHRKLLEAAIASGEVRARMSGTLVPAAPGMVNLQHLVLTREGLDAFAARLAMKVVDMPHFVTSARPLEVPAALLGLSDDAKVSYEHNIAGWRGSGMTNAAEYRGLIRDTMARQAEGQFTLSEAGQVLADSRPGLDPLDCVKRFRQAHSKGELPIHQGRSRFRLEVGATVRDFWDTVEVGELDAWLRASAGYGFPIGVAAPASAAPASAIETPKQRRARLLQMHDAEVSAGRKRGAVARITETEKRTRPTADRANIGRDIRRAREERAAERKGGALTRLLE